MSEPISPTDRGLVLMAIQPPMSDLGYANGWKDTPAIVQNCRKAGHHPNRSVVGNCVRETRCDICNYKFMVDSGG